MSINDTSFKAFKGCKDIGKSENLETKHKKYEFYLMFTGIIESLGTIKEVTVLGTNLTLWIASSISNELKADQSVAHNGICLTVEEVRGHLHRVTAIKETLSKTSLIKSQEGDLINLERCLSLNSRLDGHIVQGHIDTTGICLGKSNMEGSWQFVIQFSPEFGHLVIEKGSICLNGISLTIFNVTKDQFTIAVIPYTFEHTNIKNLDKKDLVNIEFDIIGKYVTRYAQSRS